jgi:hypothetical protein
MLSYGYWLRRFGGDRSVIGRSMDIDPASVKSSALCRKASLVNGSTSSCPWASIANYQTLADRRSGYAAIQSSNFDRKSRRRHYTNDTDLYVLFFEWPWNESACL